MLGHAGAFGNSDRGTCLLLSPLLQTVQGQTGSGPAAYLLTKSFATLPPSLLSPGSVPPPHAPSAELWFSQGGPSDLLLVKMQWHFFRSPRTTSLVTFFWKHSLLVAPGRLPRSVYLPTSLIFLVGAQFSCIQCSPGF